LRITSSQMPSSAEAPAAAASISTVSAERGSAASLSRGLAFRLAGPAEMGSSLIAAMYPTATPPG
jgi:hypothetical protein